MHITVYGKEMSATSPVGGVVKAPLGAAVADLTANHLRYYYY